MRTSVYVLAALAAASFTTASAQNTGNPAATRGTQTPVQHPRTSPTPSEPTQSSSQVTSPSPSQPTQSSQVTTPSQPPQPSQPSQATPPMQPSQPAQQTQPNATSQQAQPNAANTQQTVRPPDSARTNNANTRANDAANNAANNPARQNQSRVPPAMRGVGTTGNRPDCTRLRGIEKAECERRDTSRDDLPAGVTTTQPERPQE